MAYTRYSKKSSYGRRRWKRRGAAAGSMAYTAMQGVRRLRQLVNAEKKNHDYSVTNTDVVSSGAVHRWHDMSMGDSNFTRDGLSVLCHSIFLRFCVKMNITANSSSVRLIIFKDTQQIADTSPAVLDILETATVLSPLNRNTVGRFSILKDITLNVVENGKQSTGVRKQYIRTPGHHIRYNGATGLDIQRGGIYFLLISDQISAYPTIDYHMRLSYYDN